MDSSTWGILIVIILYLAGMVSVGIYFMKKIIQREIITSEGAGSAPL